MITFVMKKKFHIAGVIEVSPTVGVIPQTLYAALGRAFKWLPSWLGIKRLFGGEGMEWETIEFFQHPNSSQLSRGHKPLDITIDGQPVHKAQAPYRATGGAAFSCDLGMLMIKPPAVAFYFPALDNEALVIKLFDALPPDLRVTAVMARPKCFYVLTVTELRQAVENKIWGQHRPRIGS